MLGGKCVDCGTTENLQFDHKDPSKKSFNISCVLSERTFKELEKCELRCGDCHLEKTKNDYLSGVLYPGISEEVCVPIIEKNSGLKWKKDFFIGYSPERINPGDSKRTLTNIIKVISGDTKKTLDIIDNLYSRDYQLYQGFSWYLQI